MSFLDTLNEAEKAVSKTGDALGVSSLIGNPIEEANENAFKKDGFIVAPVSNADGNGLPSSKQAYNQAGVIRRKIIHWFVPEVGIVKMYINPRSIRYSQKKLISSSLTKGGYSIQYWGEELMTLELSGTTGSSGIEGINVLEQIYRAEEYMLDSYALTLAAQGQNNPAQELLDNVLSSGLDTLGLGKSSGAVGSTVGEIAGGLLGLDSNQPLPVSSVPSLASLASGVEMFYDGWVFRGFFTAFSFSESTDALGLFDYNMSFTVTQRRGYRDNYLPWQHPATIGPSDNYSMPYSFGVGTNYKK